jgi:protein O-mannosyl-transferase
VLTTSKPASASSTARSGDSPVCATTHGSLHRRTLCTLALIAIGLVTYAGRLDGPFIFDDEQSIVSNPTLWPFELARALRPPYETPVAARPLVNLSFAIDRALHGLSPHAFHATNLALHILCTLVAFAALCRLFSAPAPRSTHPAHENHTHNEVPAGARSLLRKHPELSAFVAAAAFCAHPMASEIVLYTTQRSEALVALCYLGALWLLLRAADGGRAQWPWALPLLALGALGAAAKEVFVTAPLVLLACDRAFLAGSLRAALRARGALHAALAASLVPILLLQQGAPRSESVRLLERDYLLAQLRIVPGYFAHALWPAQPVLDYGPLWPSAAVSGTEMLGLALACVLLLGIAVWTVRDPRRGFFALWTFAILAPSSSVLSIHTEIGAERRFYLPLIGVLAALVALACAFLDRSLHACSARARVAFFGAGLAAVALLMAATRQHALDYRDARTFWQAAIRSRPDNARAHYNLSETLRREGEPAAAIASLRRALALQEAYPDAHINLSGLLIAAGARAEGLTHSERGAALAPESPEAHYNLAMAYALNGLAERALTELETTLRLRPQHSDARRRLTQGYLSLGHAARAREHARALLRQVPDDPLAQHVLSLAK